MTFLVSGNACEALLEAVSQHLKADSTLDGLTTGIYGEVPRAARNTHPYVRLSSPDLDQDDFGGMGIGGGKVEFSLDTWSRNAHEVHTVLARVLVLLERQPLTLERFTLAGGSLHCPHSLVFDEPVDPDLPDKGSLYHGHQDWEADVEEAA